jgi:hypothetical protein
VDGINDDLGSSDCCRVQRRTPPGDIHRKPGEINNRAIAAVAAEIVGGSHENAVDRARFHTQGTEHAFRVVDGEAADLKAFPALHSLFADVDAIHRAGLGTLVTGNTGRQIVAMEATVAGRDRHGEFRVLKMLGKGSPIAIVRAAKNPQRDEKTFRHGGNRGKQVAKPNPHASATTKMGGERSWSGQKTRPTPETPAV